MPGTIPADLEMTYTPPGSTVSTTSRVAINIAYTNATDFIELDPGTYTFQRRRTRTNTAVGSALTITRLNAGQNFTLCARGTLVLHECLRIQNKEADWLCYNPYLVEAR